MNDRRLLTYRSTLTGATVRRDVESFRNSQQGKRARTRGRSWMLGEYASTYLIDRNSDVWLLAPRDDRNRERVKVGTAAMIIEAG